jgi:prophage antirepressor-like protein
VRGTKVENWNGHSIRFVEHEGEWWAVLKDVCDALGLRADKVNERLDGENASSEQINVTSFERGSHSRARKTQEMLIVNEFGIYDTVFQSRKKEAKEFRRWVYEMLKLLREAAGLEGFEVFRQLDREHQRAEMKLLRDSIAAVRPPARVDFIKANTIANKAVSNRHGHPKMVKKAAMTTRMLAERQSVLEDTVALMGLNGRYGIGLSISETIYGNDRR